MRVIFIDIDGVLNSSKTPNPRDLPYIVDRKLLRTFKKLVARTTCKGRSHFGLAPRPRRPVQRPLLGSPYADVVPDLPKRSRGDQIRAWLKKHSEFKRYAVIDDDDDELDDFPLFQPSSSTGLTQK
jgi:HAD domain in Swiss Army Knife RNA repair proteins